MLKILKFFFWSLKSKKEDNACPTVMTIKEKHLLNIHEVRRVFCGWCGWGALIQINLIVLLRNF